MSSVDSPRFSRRSLLLLAGAGAGLVAAGCGPEEAAEPPPAVEPVPTTVEDLLAGGTFYVAHRGSQDNWPEHTAEAYRRSLEAGARAIEVSVQRTSDGVYVCHHDADTLRMTGRNRKIAQSTVEQLGRLSNDAKQWLGPRSAAMPIPLLTDVLDAHAGTAVIFLEDKSAGDPEPLLDIMDRYPDSTRHFVWKQPGSAERHRPVKSRGYSVWGYFTREEMDQLTAERAREFDLIGVEAGAEDEEIQRAAGYDRPLMCWEIHTRSQRDRVVGLGARGIMCANIPYVMSDAASARADSFVTGRRAAGDLPGAVAWENQPTIQPWTSSLRLDRPERSSYCMGSLCPVEGEAGYSLFFEMRWPDELPKAADHAGIAFGQNRDAAYVVRQPSRSGGYHLIQRRDGKIKLMGRQSGSVSGYTLGSVTATRPVAGEWMRFQVTVGPRGVQVTRRDSTGRDWTITSESDTYRGGYFFLCRNYDGNPAVEFRSVRAEPLAN